MPVAGPSGPFALWQSQSPLGNPKAPVADPLPWGNPKAPGAPPTPPVGNPKAQRGDLSVWQLGQPAAPRRAAACGSRARPDGAVGRCRSAGDVVREYHALVVSFVVVGGGRGCGSYRRWSSRQIEHGFQDGGERGAEVDGGEFGVRADDELRQRAAAVASAASPIPARRPQRAGAEGVLIGCLRCALRIRRCRPRTARAS